MTSIDWSPVYYLGFTSAFLLLVYFYAEPRFNKDTKILGTPITYRIVCMILASTPFLYIGIAILSWFGNLLGHSLMYDIFFLRTGDMVNGAHFFDYLFIPITYFVALAFFKFDGFFSAIYAGFLAFVHEGVWFVFYYLTYGQYFNQYEATWDFSFIVFITSIAIVFFKKYRGRIWNSVFGSGLLAYTAFLVVWYVNGFKVTVINNTQIGNVNNYLSTVWYWDFLTNWFEVISWIVIFAFFVGNIVYVSSRENHQREIRAPP